jgi:hypothetical protein
MTHHDKDPYAKQRKLDVDRNKFIPGFQTPDKYAYTDAEICGQEVPLPEPPSPPAPPAIPPTDVTPKEGFVKLGGWANADINGRDDWKVVSMNDRPQLFKVVDKGGKNIATDFTTEANAENYIGYYKTNKTSIPAKFSEELKEEEEPAPGPSPAPAPSPGPIVVPDEGDPDEPDDTPDEPPAHGSTVTGPYPSIGKELESTQRGPTTRHYASGKPDDQTIEKNVKGIKYRNHQFIVYVTMKSIEHDDSVSLKYGGTHMGTGWFDNTVFFEDGATGLGTEEEHPSADLEIIKGPKIGNILNKKLGLAGIYRADENKVELWTDFQGSGWKKQVEGTNVGGFNPKASTFECQLRIDGFDDEPDIHLAVVQPIA